VPAWLVKRFVVELSPYIAALCNASFRDCFFCRRRNALSSRLALKKPAFDPTDTGNYRPMSNLSFISKAQSCLNVVRMNNSRRTCSSTV